MIRICIANVLRNPAQNLRFLKNYATVVFKYSENNSNCTFNLSVTTNKVIMYY